MVSAWSPESDNLINMLASATAEESGATVETEAKTITRATSIKRFNTKTTIVGKTGCKSMESPTREGEDDILQEVEDTSPRGEEGGAAEITQR